MKLIMLIINIQMIKQYDILRQKYIVDGYAQAYEYLESFSPSSEEEQILLSNFYCYITIQSQFKVNEAINILQSCLQKSLCVSSLKALTLYHISQALFKIEQFQLCMEKSKQIIAEFIGEYYSLEKRLEKSQKQCLVCDEIQEILYYAFLMVAYVLKNEQKMTDSKVFLDAGMRIMNDRKNLMTLTKNAKSANSSFDCEKENQFGKKDPQSKTV